MIEIRYVQSDDKKFWFELDRHLPEREFEKKVRDQQGYVLLEDGSMFGEEGEFYQRICTPSCFGIIHLFAPYCLWIGTIRKRDMAEC